MMFGFISGGEYCNDGKERGPILMMFKLETNQEILGGVH
jgi:hypothetical protein